MARLSFTNQPLVMRMGKWFSSLRTWMMSHRSSRMSGSPPASEMIIVPSSLSFLPMSRTSLIDSSSFRSCFVFQKSQISHWKLQR
ncbi:MAG: hypothetical protein QM765_22225 [Myxococcales bacterium]